MNRFRNRRGVPAAVCARFVFAVFCPMAQFWIASPPDCHDSVHNPAGMRDGVIVPATMNDRSNTALVCQAALRYTPQD
jgi:hypothetical protein